MSMILKDHAVVLRTFDFSESSLIAVLLTRENGKIRVLAKGAKRGKMRFSGSLMTGNICEIVFYYKPGRGIHILKEINCRSSFSEAGSDLKRLLIFQATIEIVDRSVIEQETDERIFILVDNFFSLLPIVEDPWAGFFAFEVKLLKLTGLFPSVKKCQNCGKNLDGERLWINTSLGHVRCQGCAREDMFLLSVSASNILKSMERKPMDNDIIGLKLSRRERREIGRFLHEIFRSHLDNYKLPSSLGLLKGVN
ncbi:MAG TPA: DNA repair protein RecO [Candidatus Krumholzibacteriaceae bacterium]|nr:DNA repair protein RecO [Candidatus Krumholzibacteriaceae bacterium]